MTLYEIDTAIQQAIENCIDSETGEFVMTEEMQQLLADRGNKLEHIILAYKNALSDAAQLKAEKDVFAEREKSAKATAERLKKMLDYALAGEGFKTDKCCVTYRRSEAVEIAEGVKLPDEYLTFKDPEPNKTELKKALKNGIEIAGVSIVERQNIQIK